MSIGDSTRGPARLPSSRPAAAVSNWRASGAVRPRSRAVATSDRGALGARSTGTPPPNAIRSKAPVKSPAARPDGLQYGVRPAPLRQPVPKRQEPVVSGRKRQRFRSQAVNSRPALPGPGYRSTTIRSASCASTRFSAASGSGANRQTRAPVSGRTRRRSLSDLRIRCWPPVPGRTGRYGAAADEAGQGGICLPFRAREWDTQMCLGRNADVKGGVVEAAPTPIPGKRTEHRGRSPRPTR